MSEVTFKPKAITKKLLGVLPDRAQDVLSSRYGLGTPAQVQTLESIGKKYGITRERVRQIENYALGTIRKSDIYAEVSAVFDELAGKIEDLGGIVHERELLESIAKDASTQNHVHFLLVLGEAFTYEKESEEFHFRWHTDSDHARSIENALTELHDSIKTSDLIPEEQIVSNFMGRLNDIPAKYRTEDAVRRYLSLSKRIGRNPLGEWGQSSSPNVRAKGMRDYAYLAVKRHGSPMHFREVAEAIEELFNKKAHVATCHNELIKDERFVLVGRGLYALSEWGYTTGVVKDVLTAILEEHGPMTRNELIDRVKKERYVKDNTIIVNLQDSSVFKKASDGRYTLA